MTIALTPIALVTGHSALTAAKNAKNDEFYTRIEDIERELHHYRDHFRDKVVLLNCDDPEWSNFWRFFELNFEFLGLKKLISTHYTGLDSGNSPPSYKLELVRGQDLNGDGKVDGHDVVRTDLLEDGDFRSPECVALLAEADVVVTNPPFSLFREYVAQLIEHDKKFLILGNMNAITYKEVWPYIQASDMWFGVTRTGTGQMWFRVNDDAPEKTGQRVLDGVRYQTVGSSAWFTNLDHTRRHEELPLFRKYSDSPAAYPAYDNYDAIEVGKVVDIPVDYAGPMGVPITFLGKHNPGQFEIVGIAKAPLGTPRKLYPAQTQIGASGARSTVSKLNDGPAMRVAVPPIDKTYYEVAGELYVQLYARILIRRKGAVSA